MWHNLGLSTWAERDNTLLNVMIVSYVKIFYNMLGYQREDNFIDTVINVIRLD